MSRDNSKSKKELLNELERANQRVRDLEAELSKTRNAIDLTQSPNVDYAPDLASIVDTETIQTMMEEFHRLTSIGIAVLDISGKVLVATGWQDLCTKFHRVHPETNENCLESDCSLSSGAKPGEFKLYKCKNNMWDIATPIVVDGGHVGNVFLGQFFFDDEEPDRESFRQQARQYGFDETKYLDALDRVPRWSREQVNTVMKFYSMFTEYVSRTGYTAAKLSKTLNELAAGEQYRAAILQTSADGFWVLDKRGRIIEVNDSYCAMSGYMRHEIIGMGVSDLDAGEPAAETAARVERILTNGHEIFEVRHRRKDGSIFPVEISASYLNVEGGQLICFCRDITVQKQYQKQLEATITRLSDAQALGGLGDWDWNPKTDIVTWSVNLYHLFGLDPDSPPPNYEGQLALYHPESAQRLHESVTQSLEQGRPYSVDLSRTKPDGRVIHLQVRGVPEMTSEGKLVHLKGTVQDITERKEAEQTILESKEQFRRLFTQSPISSFIWKAVGDEFAQIDVNIKANELTEGYAESFTGKNTAEIYPDMPEMAKKMRECLTSNRVMEFQTEYRARGSGKVRFIKFTFGPMPPDMVIMHAEDVSGEIKARQVLLEAKRAAEAANKAKSEFLANMSHEIRTPMNGILGMLQLLQMSSLNDEQKTFTESALHSGKRLTSLLTDILDISSVEAGKLTLANAPMAVGELFASVENLFSITARQKGLELKGRIDPRVPKIIVSDESRLRQILFNLVGNGVKFTTAGQVSLDICPLPFADNPCGRILLIVSDTGPGIPEDMYEIAFETFGQVSQGYMRSHQGAGLGLPIVKRLVDLMGGSTCLDSTPGKGTTFYVSIPLQVRDHKEIKPETNRAAAADFTSREKELDTACLARILLVEDEPTNAYATAQLLKRKGYEIVVAENGLIALEQIRKGGFDIVLMDVQMPVMDGVEATKAIRNGEAGAENSNLPIIAMTAYAMDGDRETFLTAGMDAYIAKPVEIDSLKELLTRLQSGK